MRHERIRDRDRTIHDAGGEGSNGNGRREHETPRVPHLRRRPHRRRSRGPSACSTVATPFYRWLCRPRVRLTVTGAILLAHRRSGDDQLGVDAAAGADRGADGRDRLDRAPPRRAVRGRVGRGRHPAGLPAPRSSLPRPALPAAVRRAELQHRRDGPRCRATARRRARPVRRRRRRGRGAHRRDRRRRPQGAAGRRRERRGHRQSHGRPHRAGSVAPIR